METLKWLLESIQPTIVSFILSCVITFYTHGLSADNSNDLLAGTINISKVVPWIWLITAVLFFLYAVVGKIWGRISG